MGEIPTSGLIETVVGAILNAALQGAGAVANEALTIATSLIEEIARTFTRPYTGYVLLALTVNAVEQGATNLKPLLSQLVSVLTGSSDLAAAVTQATSFDIFSQSSQAIGQYYASKVLNLFNPPGEISPESGLQAAQNFIGLNLMAAANSFVFGYIADAISLGHLRLAGELPQQIESALGLNRLTRLIFEDLIKMTVSTPLKEGMLRKYLPNNFTEGQLIELNLQGFISDDEYKDAMMSQGFDNVAAGYLLSLKKKHLPEKLLKQLFDFQVIDESVFKQGLQQLGYTTDDIDTIFPFLQNERVYTYTEKIAEEALTLYESGRITDSQLRDFLSTAHWQDLEITTAIQYADLKKMKVTLSSSEVLELYRHKLMTQTDAITYLENIGYNSTDANLLLQLEIAKEAPKPPRVRVLGGHTLTVAEILKAYKERINSLQETVSRLKEYGYSDEDISDLLALNPPK